MVVEVGVPDDVVLAGEDEVVVEVDVELVDEALDAVDAAVVTEELDAVVVLPAAAFSSLAAEQPDSPAIERAASAASPTVAP